MRHSTRQYEDVELHLARVGYALIAHVRCAWHTDGTELATAVLYRDDGHRQALAVCALSPARLYDQLLAVLPHPTDGWRVVSYVRRTHALLSHG